MMRWAVVLMAGLSVTLAVPPDARGQGGTRAPDSARGCAECHLQWTAAFTRPGARTLIPRPPRPVVADEATCLGCHDGSVDDSRREVWLDHGHKTDILPPDDMEIPAGLPLDDGRITCRTCHTAHAGVGPETIATTFFLRVPNETSQLCHMCHTGYGDGITHGSHPLTLMEQGIPEELLRAGASGGPDHNLITCQSCHLPHGSRQDDLLVMGTADNALCMSCHESLTPEWWRDDTHQLHHRMPTLTTDAQHQAVRDMGTRAGTDAALICMTCHRMHDSHEQHYLLADTLTDSTMCIRCHPQQREVIGSGHDLRMSAPEERNLFDLTAEQGGPCSACHAAHAVPREMRPDRVDVSGRCMTCHSAGQCAEGATFRSHDHPHRVSLRDLPEALRDWLQIDPTEPSIGILSCQSCHDPHETKHGLFLAQRPDDLCAGCHVDQATSLAGAHDFLDRPDLRNARGRTAAEVGQCGFCHAVHDAGGPVLWAATTGTFMQPDDLCLSCHAAGDLTGMPPWHELRHPSGPETAGAAARLGADLPLFDHDARPADDGFVTCSSCHATHGDSRRLASLLRRGGTERPVETCHACHQETAHMAMSLHSEPFMRAFVERVDGDLSVTMCAPCHQAHVPAGVEAVGMWTGPRGPADRPEDMQNCLGCHGPDGGATPVRLFIHPDVGLVNVQPPGSPGYMPLADEQGRLGSRGRVTCQTCHLPHGREPGNGFLAVDAAAFDPDRLRALTPMIRPYVAPNLCSSCHGPDGLAYYLYYHDPERRARVTRERLALPLLFDGRQARPPSQRP